MEHTYEINCQTRKQAAHRLEQFAGDCGKQLFYERWHKLLGQDQWTAHWGVNSRGIYGWMVMDSKGLRFWITYDKVA